MYSTVPLIHPSARLFTPLTWTSTCHLQTSPAGRPRSPPEKMAERRCLWSAGQKTSTDTTAPSMQQRREDRQVVARSCQSWTLCTRPVCWLPACNGAARWSASHRPAAEQVGTRRNDDSGQTYCGPTQSHFLGGVRAAPISLKC